MANTLTAQKVMQYQAGGLFMCTLFFAASQMYGAAAIALAWSLIGVFLQIRLGRQSPDTSPQSPS